MKKTKIAVISLLSLLSFVGASITTFSMAEPGRLHFITAFLNSF
ncbi:hypothetical protein MKZ08_14660 [Viridibacillus sp. FSL R5-0477]|nr:MULTISPECIES: hypothetical protein [Viridibacillus]